MGKYSDNSLGIIQVEIESLSTYRPSITTAAATTTTTMITMKTTDATTATAEAIHCKDSFRV